MSNLLTQSKRFLQKQVLAFILGIGGTGTIAARAVKRALVQTFRDGRAYLLIHDIDPNDKEEFGKQYIKMKPCPTYRLIADILSHPERYPGYRHMGDLAKMKRAAGSSQYLEYGAQKSRPWSRTQLMHELLFNQADYDENFVRGFEYLKPAGEQPVEVDVFSQATASEGVSSTSPYVDLPMFFGIGGGCGSGVGNDMSRYIQYIARYKAGVEDVRIHAHLFLPNCHRHHDRRRLNANGEAALLELMEVYEQDFMSPRQLGPVELEGTEMPFASITLWSRTTAGQKSYANEQKVAEVAAECLRMQLEGAIGATYRSLSANKLDIQYPYIAKAHGGYRITLEIEEMQQVGGYHLAQQLTKDYLLRQLEADTAQKQAEGQAQDFSHLLKLDQQAGVFARDDKGRPITASLDLLAKSPRKSLPGKIKDFEKKALAVAKVSLDKARTAKCKRYKVALSKFIEGILNSIDGGVHQGLAFLKALNHLLSQQQSRIRQQLARTAKDLEAWNQKQAKRDQNPLKRIAINMRADYLAHMEQKINLELEKMKLEALLDLLSQEQAVIEEHLKGLTRWKAAFEHAGQQLAVKLAQFQTEREVQRPVCIENALKPEQELTFVKKELQLVFEDAKQGLLFEWNNGAFVLSYRSMSSLSSKAQSLWDDDGLQKVLDYASGFFGGLAELSIEPILQQYYGMTPQEIVDMMAEHAAPLVQINPLVQKEPQDVLTIFTSTQGADGFFKPAASMSDWTCIASDNPHNVELLISWFKINPNALVMRPLMKKDYNALKHTEVLHVFDWWHERLARERELVEAPVVDQNHLRTANGPEPKAEVKKVSK